MYVFDFWCLVQFLCFIGRAASVFPLSYLLNLKRKHTIPFKHQLVFWFGGLRGPVAFALAAATPGHARDVILTTTSLQLRTHVRSLFIIAVTTICLGGLAYPFIKFVKPSIMRSTIQTRTKSYDISHHWFNKLDQRFLKPLFGPAYRRPDIGDANAHGHDHGHDHDANDTHHAENEHNEVNTKPELELADTEIITNETMVGTSIGNADPSSPNNATNTEANENDVPTEAKSSQQEPEMKTLEAPTKPLEYSNARTQPVSYLENPNELSQSGTWEENPVDTSKVDSGHVGAVPSVSPPPRTKYQQT
ncbi:hypothetical protein RFI_17300 [Reticulomyxa filosa]|uniref:Cation/H+ exchanger transmembrane domain-containing protein n=1 Tax=Reticulomyxa filosa TaxID=46433 RepID=X6N217_RETFI|nr:hypothetical protein RFI_17300 [Reticulomyxa filosa]|eukprot:ETO19918.1 hypothetical protein RFI_17300 [Reticulomyxa filosa]